MDQSGLGRYLLGVLGWLAVMGAIYGFWRWFLGFVAPFVLAAVVAVLLKPLVQKLESAGCSPGWASVVSLAVGLGGGLAVFGIMVGVLVAELVRLARALPLDLAGWQGRWDRQLAFWGRWGQRFHLSPLLLQSQLNSVTTLVEGIIRGALLALAGIPASLLLLMIALVAAYFLLRDRIGMAALAVRLLPPPWRSRGSQIQAEVLGATMGFFKAQLMLAALTALGTMAGLWAIGARFTVLAGLAAGLLDLIPFMGPTVVLLPWTLGLWLSGRPVVAIEMAAVMVGVGLMRQLVEPRWVGRSTGLHPLLVLVAMYLGIRLFGPAGFFIGPLSAVMMKSMSTVLLPPAAGAG